MTASKRDLLMVMTAFALAMGLVNRLFAGWDAPLWFDETFSAVIASQHSLPDLLHWCLNELSGPVYYTTLFLWEKLAGNGDMALRIPSFLFSIATPLLILWRGHPDRTVRLVWAAVSALWITGFDIATEARPYTLVVLLGTAQGIIFMAMIARPSTRRALIWTSLSALSVLTHYHAALLCGLQGLAYLAIHRGRAFRTWPALVPLLPMALWMAYHLPFILQFATPGTVWYQTLTPERLWFVTLLIGGTTTVGLLLFTIPLVGWLAQAVAALRGRAAFPYNPPESLFVATGLLAFLLVIGAGFYLPSFTPRYLLPYMPALLFGIALFAARIGYGGVILIAAMLGWSVPPLMQRIANPTDDRRYAFNFEEPARWIGARDVHRVVMLWDNPTMSISSSAHIASVAGFFWAREGRSMAIAVERWPGAGTDPNQILLKAAGHDPKAAILWAYDASVPGTRAARFPQHIAALDGFWACRDFGRRGITVLACRPRI